MMQENEITQTQQTTTEQNPAQPPKKRNRPRSRNKNHVRQIQLTMHKNTLESNGENAPATPSETAESKPYGTEASMSNRNSSPFLRFERNQIAHVIRFHLNRRNCLLHFICFNFRAIQNIVDNTQQMFCRADNLLDVVILLWGQLVFVISWESPMIAFIGVLISWLIWAKNSPCVVS